MRKRIVYRSLVFVVLFSAFNASAQAQNGKDSKRVVNINRLNVIYDDEDNVYPEFIPDRTSQPQPANNVPPMLTAPQEDDEELEQASQIYRPAQMGEGAESEMDIIYATMDSVAIHIASNAPLPEGKTIYLTDPSKNRRFCYPTNEKSIATSHFGARRRRFHYGVDLAMPTGEPIYAVFDGIVRVSKFNKSYGNLVVVRHYNGLETYYAHMSQRDVSPGDTVKAGEVLGLCGNTGRSYGSHLHLEIRYMGKAINPEYIIDCTNRKLYSDEITIGPAYFRKSGSSRYAPNIAELHRINSKAGTAANNASTVAPTQPRNPNAKPAPKPQTGPKYYKVRSGDTLSKIAKRNGTTVKRLCQLNGIKETTILQIGRNLRVR